MWCFAVRNVAELAEFRRSLSRTLQRDCKCNADKQPARVFGAEHALCDCRTILETQSRAFDGCIPNDFWDATEDDIHENTEIFQDIVSVYSENMNKALKHGYGLFLEGLNGSGKTLFLSWVLMEVIRWRPFSVYYTTMPRLSHDTKMGFKDPERAKRLESYLKRDFVVFDELGKEKFKDGDSYDRTVFEHWFRWRNDNAMPVLIASNATKEDLGRPPEKGGYGNMFASMVSGKMKYAKMKDCDYRKRLGREMRESMGY